jgi:hypothetical protein
MTMAAVPIRVGGHAIVVLLGLIGIAAVVTSTLATASPARAATAYRYWAYYVAHESTWQYSARGPATEYPVDGEVQGWRFAIQVDAGNGLEPEATTSFTKLCDSTPVKVGDMRVGVVLDFGGAADAPSHEHPPATVVPGCVSVPTGSTGAEVLQAAATVRIGTGADAGLVCGIDGYPATECAVAVAASAPTQLGTPTPHTSPRVTATATPPTASAVASTATSAAAPTSPTLAASSAPIVAAAPPGPSTSPSAAASSPIGSTLVALRTTDHHRLPVLTVVGGVLAVALGGGAIWRARAGRR